MTRSKSVRNIVWVLLTILLLWGCGSGEAKEDREQVRVESFQYRLLPGGARILSGELYNPTEADIPSAQIQVSLFDAENRRISSASILVQNIAAGTRKAFRQSIDSDLDVRGARVHSVIVL